MNRKLFKNYFAVLLIIFCIFVSGCTLSDAQGNFDTDSTILPKDTLSVHFIDVGQGDATLIFTPNSEVILVDAGPASSGNDLLEYLNSQGIEKIDYLISTHPHEDHIGGMVKVLENFEVGMILDPAYAHTTKTFERYLEKIDELDIPFIAARSGDSYTLGEVRAQVLWPVDVPANAKDINEISIVILLEYMDFSLLLTGDIGEKTEGSLVDNHSIGEVTVLKVAHHGSRGSSSKKFIDLISPSIAVISLGESNSYGHPTQEALERLSGSDIYRTDLNGSVIVETDGVNVWVQTSK